MDFATAECRGFVPATMRKLTSHSQLTSDGEFEQFVTKGYVAPSPEEALARIAEAYECQPNRLGTNCEGLECLRTAISELAGDRISAYANALVLVAPHTHWTPCAIIQSYDTLSDRYWIGPQSGRLPYFPVSFFFCRDNPTAYEWADASCGLSLTDLQEVWIFVKRLNDFVIKQIWYQEPFVFGVSINHRFKNLFSPATFSTHEGPDEADSGLSYVVRGSSTDDLDGTHLDQVGWSASIPPPIGDGGSKNLTALEEMLSEYSQTDAEAILQQLLRDK